MSSFVVCQRCIRADDTLESITPLPGLGLQLSTTKYLAIPWVHTSTPIVLSTSKTFIPLSEISTVVINEGLTRWSVRYFLAVVQRGGTGIHIAFKVRRCVRSQAWSLTTYRTSDPAMPSCARCIMGSASSSSTSGRMTEHGACGGRRLFPQIIARTIPRSACRC